MDQIPLIELPDPAELPRSRADLCGGMAEAERVLLKMGAAAIGAEDRRSALQALRQALAHRPRPEYLPAPSPADTAASFDHHDSYCRIIRVSGEPVGTFAAAVLRGYETLLEEAADHGASLGSDYWRRLRMAFDSMIRYSLNETGGDAPPGVYVNSGLDGPNENDAALVRWIRGHHVFLILIQCLIVSLNCFGSAVEAGYRCQAADALSLAITLMNGAAAALYFACDFEADTYDATVRPSMMPPASPPGMSGLLSRDHNHLVKLLYSQRETVSRLETGLQTQYSQLLAAFACTYEAHKGVCSRFRGDEHSSLLSATVTESAVSVLDRMKKARLRRVDLQ